MSYGVNAPWGLRPMMKRGASTFDMCSTYPIQSGQTGNIFTGDLVAIGPTTGYIQALNVVSYNDGAIAGGKVTTSIVPVGVFMGCTYTAQTASNPTNPYQMSPMWPSGATTATGGDALAYVIDDPTVLFNIQADNNNAALPLTGPTSIIGYNATVSWIGISYSAGTSSVAPTGSAYNNALNTTWTTSPPGTTSSGAGNTKTGQSGMMLATGSTYSSISSSIALGSGGANGSYVFPAPSSNSFIYPLKINGVVNVPGNICSTANVTGITFVNLIVSLNNAAYQFGSPAI